MAFLKFEDSEQRVVRGQMSPLAFEVRLTASLLKAEPATIHRIASLNPRLNQKYGFHDGGGRFCSIY